MNDLNAAKYIPDLMCILIFIGMLILQFYRTSARFPMSDGRKKGLAKDILLLLTECGNLIFLFHWFNERHGERNVHGDGLWIASSNRMYVVELCIFLLFFALGRLWRTRPEELGNDSIAEAILNLPTGLCFADCNGQILLENIRMQDIWYESIGHNMTDERAVWNYFKEHLDPDGIMQTKDGKVWKLSRQIIEGNDGAYVQIKAEDVTELNHLYMELNATNHTLDLQNRKTGQLLQDIAKLNEDEERLDIQRLIHHEVGQCVIAARHYLDDGEGEDAKEKVLSMWERVFQGNLPEEEESMEEKEAEICEAAEISGCKIIFEGFRPCSDKSYRLYLAAIREAVTNAIRHAGAETVYVDGEMIEGQLQVCITNDGRKPEGFVTEGIGLGKLREKLERAGIRMELEYEEAFCMKLKFPEKGEKR